MAKTYNGRFEIPKKPGSGTGWLVLGVVLMLGGTPGIAFGVLCLCKYSSCRREYKLYERFFDYCAVIGMRRSVAIRDLAKSGDRSVSDVRKDLNRMIAKGYFGEGAYLDMQHGSLVLPDMKSANWKDVITDLLHSIRREFGSDPVEDVHYSPEPEPEPAPEPKQEAAPAEPRNESCNAKKTYMDELERTLNELYQLNMCIDDEGVSRRIDRIGELTGGIFRTVIENPDREAEVRKFMNYYLPTTLKLLKSYDMMEDQSFQGENILASRRKIENVLDMLIEAYEKQLDRLFSNDALDIAADIDVLETMMAGDGLSSKGTLKL